MMKNVSRKTLQKTSILLSVVIVALLIYIIASFRAEFALPMSSVLSTKQQKKVKIFKEKLSALF